jgi:hypothetical protein
MQKNLSLDKLNGRGQSRCGAWADTRPTNPRRPPFDTVTTCLHWATVLLVLIGRPATAIAASLLLVVTLPPSSTVLVDQNIAGQVNLHARAGALDEASRVVLLQICRLLDVTI